MKQTILLVSIFLSIVYNSQVLAQSEPPARSGVPALSVRQAPNADYEAVVTYGSDQFCIIYANPASSIQINGNSILIESPAADVGACIEPSPPLFVFEEVAELGVLAEGVYTVEWVQASDFSLTTTFEVSGLPPEPIANANPYPETGLWYNPDESGTGFDLEFQNGIIAGHYFGYDANGEPEWFMVSGTLIQSMTPGVIWELETDPNRYTGGNCFGCAYQKPNAPDLLAPIKFEFLERALMKLTLSDSSVQYMVPIFYGDASTPVATGDVTQSLPEFVAGSSQWVIVFTDNDETTQTSTRANTELVQINSPEAPVDGPFAGMLVYAIDEVNSPIGRPPSFGYIFCEQNVDPVCHLQFEGRTEFEIPIGNFTDSRFFGNAANGNTAQGFRLNYD